VSAAFYFDGDVWKGTVLNFSESGVFIASSAPVREGDTLLLRFRRPTDSETIQVQGMVARVVARASARGSREFGAQLFELLGSLNPSPGPADDFPEDMPQSASLLAARDASLDESVSLETSGEPLVAAPPSAPPEIVVPEAPPAPPADPEAVSGPESSYRARESRFVFHIPCYILTRHKPGEKVPAVIHNVSRKGVFIQTPVELGRGDVIGIVLGGADVDGGIKPLELYADVAWAGSRAVQGGDIPGVGCRLTRTRKSNGWKRWETLLRAFLTSGNPIFRKTLDE